MPAVPRSTASQTEKIATLISVLMILIVVAVLYFAKEVFVPLALALLFSFLLAPLVTRFERWRLPRVPAVLLSVGLSLAVVAGVGWLVVNQLVDLTEKLPTYKVHIANRIDSIKKSTGGKGVISRATDTIKELQAQATEATPEAGVTRPDGPTSANKENIRKVEVVQPATSLIEVAQSVVGPVLGPVGTGAVVLVFVLFMLLKREDLRDRIIHLVGKGQLNVTTQALDEAAGKVTGYLTMQVIINVCFGVPVGIGLTIIGIPNAFLWGMLATILRFVPYIGAWIALFFPLALSLATTETWATPIEVLALFAVIELVTSNVLEPWLYGAHTGLSPVAIMVATIFWTWLWGGVGLLLATPLTVCVAVLGKYIPSLSFLDALLGDEPTLSFNDRYYQRLLAMDRREACIVADEYRKTHTAVETYSNLFVPALAAAEREEGSGAIDSRHQRFIFDTTRELIEDIVGDSAKPSSDAKTSGKDSGGNTAADVPVPTLSKHPVFCLPAADEADEVIALMVAHALEREGYKSESLSYKTLANEMVAQISGAGSTVVCISVTPPHDDLHVRYLCKLIRARLPKIYIVVGMWEFEADEARLLRRREKYKVDKVVTKLSDALDFIYPLAVLDIAEDATETPEPALATA